MYPMDALNACVMECTIGCTSALPSLKFAGDGSSFKILQIADAQVSDFVFDSCSSLSEAQLSLGPCTAYNTTQFMEKLIQNEKPDLIVFTGDNISGAVRMEDTMSKLYGPAIASGLPWTAVFGNHDPESLWKKDKQVSLCDVSVPSHSCLPTYLSVFASLLCTLLREIFDCVMAISSLSK
jgi:predicted MPP superfamily phosphohydrolase